MAPRFSSASLSVAFIPVSGSVRRCGCCARKSAVRSVKTHSRIRRSAPASGTRCGGAAPLSGARGAAAAAGAGPHPACARASGQCTDVDAAPRGRIVSTGPGAGRGAAQSGDSPPAPHGLQPAHATRAPRRCWIPDKRAQVAQRRRGPADRPVPGAARERRARGRAACIARHPFCSCAAQEMGARLASAAGRWPGARGYVWRRGAWGDGGVPGAATGSPRGRSPGLRGAAGPWRPRRKQGEGRRADWVQWKAGRLRICRREPGPRPRAPQARGAAGPERARGRAPGPGTRSLWPALGPQRAVGRASRGESGGHPPPHNARIKTRPLPQPRLGRPHGGSGRGVA